MSELHTFAAEAPNGLQLAGDINEVIWGSIAFFVVLGLIIWKAGPLIVKAMKDRTEGIELELAQAKEERAAAEMALTASTSDLPDVGAEEAKIRSEAQATATKLKEDLIAKAEAEAEALKERGRIDVDNLKRQAQADLASEVSLMTRNTAEAVVTQALDGDSQSELIENYISQVSGM